MKYIFGNWKMYLDYQESIKLAKVLSKEKFNDGKVKLAIFPTALSLSKVVEDLRGSNIKVGSQDHTWRPKGAYTGAVSALMFKDVGCEYALIGHSERRFVFGETDDEIRKKIEESLNVGLAPVVCIGETKGELAGGKREYRLKKQMMKAFADLSLNGGKIIIAYEPVWAIGTGIPCLPADADDVHGWIKQELKRYFKQDIPVLYGGSVNSENVVSYLALETVDGALVGGASAKLETFVPLIRAAEEI